MSIKLMAQVWERKLNKAEQSVLLAMADHARDDGSQCYPSVDWVAWKTDYSPRQVQRTIKALTARGVLALVRGYGRGRSNEYRIDLSATEPKPDYVAKGDTMSPHNKHDIVSLLSAKGDIVSPQTDTEPMLKGDICDIKGDIHDIKGDIAMSPEPLEPPIEPTEEKDDDDTRTRTPIELAWFETFGGELPTNLVAPVTKLVGETSAVAVIHGIRASAGSESRSFKYIAQCARNYIPPGTEPPQPAASYVVDVPGVFALRPPAQPTAPLPHSPPMPHDDPWAIAVAELAPVFAANSAGRWLTGSRLEANGQLAGVPFYRVVLTCPGADAQWMTQQAEPAIRKKLASLLGKRIQLEITVAERVPA